MTTKKPSTKKAATSKPKKAAPKPQSKAKPVKKPAAAKTAAKPKPQPKAKPEAKSKAKASPAAKTAHKAAAKPGKPAPAADKPKQPTGKAKGAKPKASDYVKRPSHTPAIFKPPSKRATHIVLSMDEVRELLRKRSQEDRKHNGHEGSKSNGVAHEASGKASHSKGSSHRASKHQAASLADILGINPATRQGGHGSVPRKHQKYYKLLVELRDHVREELNLHSSDTLKRSQKEDAGDLSISVDAGTDNFDRDFALSLLSSEQESLKEIEAAIQRIHDGTYGVCEVTGKPIDAERLEAVPFTRFSLEGQREYENNQRRRTTRTGAFLNEASAETISFGEDDGDN